MKQLLLTAALLLVLTSCSGRKQIGKAISHGNYDQAIQEALEKLDRNKDKPRKQDFIVLLEDAYYKAMQEDLQRINILKKDSNPEYFKTIYEMYLDLDDRQLAIKRVLPLKINGKDFKLEFKDYASEIVDYRYKTSEYLLALGKSQLSSENKYDAREAYDQFSYVDAINPNFKDTRALLQEAHLKGTDFVMVYIENQTNQIIPKQLETDVLNFDTYGLGAFWTTYHGYIDQNLNYDYDVVMRLKAISLSPERVHEKQKLNEKNIIDGWEYKKDRNGSILLDSLGNKMKIDKIINAKARYFEVSQYKSIEVIGDVIFTKLSSNRPVDSFKLNSIFVFENFYAWARGDVRALSHQERELTRNRAVPFPSDQQMVFDTGEDLKLQLKNILSAYTLN
jgi:hypothetical protein